MLIVAVGRLRDEAEREIVARYRRRADDVGRRIGLGPVEIVELPESRAGEARLRQDDEAVRLLHASVRANVLIALDEKGKALTSAAFAALLATKRDGGDAQLALLIGGPDGHGAAVARTAHLRLCLGAMTLPHGLARAVLAEQIYRATTILAGHPYHRA